MRRGSLVLNNNSLYESEDWPGNNIFACKGHCVMGPSYYTIILTFFLITIPGILFLLYPAYVF